MIVFSRQPDGNWTQSGEQLPTENFYTIAIDAARPAPQIYIAREAVSLVKRLIATGQTGNAYRYELAAPAASLKWRTP